MESIKDILSHMISISDREMERILSHCYAKGFKKKALLSDDDKFIDEVYFIESGIIRVKITDLSGKEHTSHLLLRISSSLTTIRF